MAWSRVASVCTFLVFCAATVAVVGTDTGNKPRFPIAEEAFVRSMNKECPTKVFVWAGDEDRKEIGILIMNSSKFDLGEGKCLLTLIPNPFEPEKKNECTVRIPRIAIRRGVVIMTSEFPHWYSALANSGPATPHIDAEVTIEPAKSKM
jgi:hypothetical protein